jgi:hypothetical protein
MMSKSARFLPLRWLLAVLLSLLWTTVGGAAALAERGDFGHSRIAANNSDHVILGLRANGLEQTAEQIGTRHLLNDANWLWYRGSVWRASRSPVATTRPRS